MQQEITSSYPGLHFLQDQRGRADGGGIARVAIFAVCDYGGSLWGRCHYGTASHDEEKCGGGNQRKRVVDDRVCRFSVSSHPHAAL